MCQDSGEADLGVIAQNSQGLVLASLSEKITLPPLVDDEEVMVAARAILFSQELGLSSFVVEGDCEIIIDALRSEYDSFASYGHLLASAKSLKASFDMIYFSRTRRQGNIVAHNLTKHARYISSLMMWMEDFPPHFHDVILSQLWLTVLINDIHHLSSFK